jgi:hypothetical protein
LGQKGRERDGSRLGRKGREEAGPKSLLGLKSKEVKENRLIDFWIKIGLEIE